ncbi:MAG: hypothetical protein ABI693_28960 [Bryobacteraceae bacterium]
MSDKRPPRPSTEAILRISLGDAGISFGGRAVLHVELANSSKRPFTVIESSAQRSFEIHVVDSHGSEPPLTESAKIMRHIGRVPDVNFRNFAASVEPGDVLKADMDIAEAYVLAEPGKYTVTVCRMVTEFGPVLSNAVTLLVRPQ